MKDTYEKIAIKNDLSSLNELSQKFSQKVDPNEISSNSCETVINKASCDRHIQSEKHQKKGKFSTVSEPPKSLQMLDIQKQLEASKRKHLIYKDESNL